MKTLALIPFIIFSFSSHSFINKSFFREVKFLTSCRYGNLKLAEKLLVEKNVDINTQDAKKGWTCLHYAVRNSNLELIHLLIEKGADINQVDNEGKPPYFYVDERNKELKDDLLEITQEQITAINDLQEIKNDQ